MAYSLLDFLPSNQAIDECFFIEAESYDSILADAIHQPINLIKKDSFGISDSSFNEEDLFKDLMKSDNHNFKISLLKGEPGAGKTHLVRWIKSQIEKKCSNQVIISILKNRNIDEILKMIKDKFNYLNLDENIPGGKTFSSQFDNLTKLKNTFNGNLLDQIDKKLGTVDPFSPEGRTLSNLKILLADENYKSPLYAENNGIFYNLLQQATLGNQNRNELTTDIYRDFNPIVENYYPVNKNQATSYLAICQSAETISLAKTEVNYLVDKALNYVIKMTYSNLSLLDAFRTIRKSLKNEKKELILLIEDIRTCSGLKDDLKTTIADVDSDINNVEMCKLRSLIAFTSDENIPLGTDRTRAVLWELKELNEENKIERSINLIGAYLNIARYGKKRICENKNWKIFGEGNVDEKSLEILEWFRKSSNGYYLFPFNDNWIKRILKDNKCLPRDIINHILIKYLKDSKEQFPTLPLNEFSEIPIPNKISVKITDAHASYSKLFNYCDQSSLQTGFADVPEMIYKLFKLNPIDTKKPIKGHEISDPFSKVYKDKKEKFEKISEILDKWRVSKKMDHTIANTIKNDMFGFLIDSIDFETELTVKSERSLNDKILTLTPSSQRMHIKGFPESQVKLSDLVLNIEFADVDYTIDKMIQEMLAVEYMIIFNIIGRKEFNSESLYEEFRNEKVNQFMFASNFCSRFQPQIIKHLRSNYLNLSKRISDFCKIACAAGLISFVDGSQVISEHLLLDSIFMNPFEVKSRLFSDTEIINSNEKRQINIFLNQIVDVYSENKMFLDRLIGARQRAEAQDRILCYDIAQILNISNELLIQTPDNLLDYLVQELKVVSPKTAIKTMVGKCVENYFIIIANLGQEFSIVKLKEGVKKTFPNVENLPLAANLLKWHEWIDGKVDYDNIEKDLILAKELSEINLEGNYYYALKLLTELNISALDSANKFCQLFIAYETERRKGINIPEGSSLEKIKKDLKGSQDGIILGVEELLTKINKIGGRDDN